MCLDLTSTKGAKNRTENKKHNNNNNIHNTTRTTTTKHNNNNTTQEHNNTAQHKNTTRTQGAGTPAKNTGIAETMLKLKNRQISVPT